MSNEFADTPQDFNPAVQDVNLANVLGYAMQGYADRAHDAEIRGDDRRARRFWNKADEVAADEAYRWLGELKDQVGDATGYMRMIVGAVDEETIGEIREQGPVSHAPELEAYVRQRIAATLLAQEGSALTRNDIAQILETSPITTSKTIKFLVAEDYIAEGEKVYNGDSRRPPVTLAPTEKLTAQGETDDELKLLSDIHALRQRFGLQTERQVLTLLARLGEEIAPEEPKQ
ncbi:MAG TPA: helix-turn-helix domain-containing protein [Candidatus Saccharimonadales bacterium]|jgi:hypothetical protein|nr:helix-turn-helix domain-containing protein [Candidatus Saccharimonadales bacterium]